MSKQHTSMNYVNNEEFYNKLVAWKESGDEKIPNDIALILYQICNNLAKSGRFAGYTWREEMVEDAIFATLKFCKNFNPEKSKNPFAFYTQIAYNAFIKRINIEKLHLETLSEYKDQITTLYDIQEDVDDDESYSQIENTAKRINRTYMKTSKKKPKKPKMKTLEDFM